MQPESLKKVKKTILLQRRIKAERHILIFVAIWRDHAPNPRCYRYLAWTRSSGSEAERDHAHMLSSFCVITLILAFPDLALIADVVAILRDHAHVWWSSQNADSRFCRYFAWSRSFVATRLTWFISYRWWWPSGGRQILSLFCVITLCWVIPVQTSIADVVAIMHQNAPFVDFCKSSIADFVAILREHALFCNFH